MAKILKQKHYHNKHYTYHEMENGIRCALIQDPEIDDTTIAITIASGSLNDPFEFQGLSHLFEHMLFQGSQQYPAADYLIQRCQQSGGYVNAMTSPQHCTIECTVPTKNLVQIVDVIADALIHPLLTPASIEQQMAIIEQEFQAKNNDDLAKLHQLQCHIANHKHRFHHFATGNAVTFSQHDTQAWQHALQTLHANQIHGNNVGICIVSPLNEQSVLSNILQCFSGIPHNESTSPAKVINHLQRFNAEHLSIKTTVLAQSTTQQLLLNFAMPPVRGLYTCKPLQLTTELLCQQGDGGLFEQLKSRHWITDMSAGFELNGSEYSDFNIHLLLTSNGEKNLQRLIDFVFLFIRGIKQIATQQWRFTELTNEHQIVFDNLTLRPWRAIAGELSTNILYYPWQDVISGNYTIPNPASETEIQFLNLLVPKSMRIFHLASAEHLLQLKLDLSVFTESIEPWYQTPYLSHYLKEPTTDTAPDVKFTFPGSNIYLESINSRAAIQCKKNRSDVSISEQDFRTWSVCRQDNQQQMGECYIALRGDGLISDIKHKVMIDMLVAIMNHRFRRQFHQAIKANINLKFYASVHGLSIQAKGYCHGLSTIIINIARDLAQNTFSENECVVAIEEIKQKYQIKMKSKLIHQMFAYLNHHMLPMTHGVSDKLDTLLKITPQTIQLLQQQLFYLCNVDVLFGGDWEIQQITALEDHLRTISKRNNIAKTCSELGLNTVTDQHQKVAFTSPLTQQVAQITYLYSTQANSTDVASFMLAEAFASPLLFQTMREQHSAYVMGIHYLPHGSHPGLVLYAQLKSKQKDTLSKQLDDFLTTLKTLSKELLEGDYDKLKRQVISQLNKPEPHVSQFYKTFWSRLFLPNQIHHSSHYVKQAIEALPLKAFCHFLHSMQTLSHINRVDILEDELANK